MRGIGACVAIAFLCFSECVLTDDIIVRLPQGDLQGKEARSSGEHLYYSFQGIPYAEPPVGELRFKPPERHSGWSGTRDATQEGSVCVQVDEFIKKGIDGDEDCLFLNVFTRKMPKEGEENPRMAVMVWIHGGGFIIGSSQALMYHPGYLMDYDIVLVTINYRLNIFGFLSTEDEHAHGNYGMLDQVQALKWVQENVEYFGGDPTRVTIFGESAGGASVHFLVLSPLARGLFVNAIAMSGVTTDPWAVQWEARDVAERLGDMVGCPRDSSLALIECLRTKDSLELVAKTMDFRLWSLMPLTFTPRVDSEAENPFLPDDPKILLQEGRFAKVPFMTGVTREEGIMFIYPALLNETLLPEIDGNWDFYCPRIFLGKTEDTGDYCSRLRKQYLGDQPINRHNRYELVRMAGDQMMNAGALETVKAQSRFVPTYLYSFEYEGSSGFMDFIRSMLVMSLPEEARDSVPKIHGDLRGKEAKSSGEHLYYSFQGIPYAEPPVGELRFKPPERHSGWSGTRDATQEGSVCVQVGEYIEKGIDGDEDCLFLNVFTRKMPKEGEENPKMVVMVWIHGGGFVFGSSQALMYNPEYLMDYDIVLVSINYRLNIFGFLSTEDEHAHGNYGMLDQVQALKWVQENVEYFGGDPSRVTIFGASAGGASVHFLVLSPLARGLFTNAIAMSGVATNLCALQWEARDVAEKLGDMVGCPRDSSRALVECLRTKDSQELMAKSLNFRLWSLMPLTFTPRVDSEAENPFLPDDPKILLRKGRFAKVPFMTGVTRDEGFLSVYKVLLNETLLPEIDGNWDYYCPRMFLGKTEDTWNYCSRLRKQYFGDRPINRHNRYDLVRMMGDHMVKVGTLETVKAQSRFVPTYLYSFEYEGSHRFLDFIRSTFVMSLPEEARDSVPKLTGVAHAEDIVYLLPAANIPGGDERDAAMKDILTGIVVQFAKSGDPTPDPRADVKWPQWTQDDPRHFVFDFHPRLSRNLMDSKFLDFWEQLLASQPKRHREEL
ncbi:unnamed protein product [Darwinula stevensoni]|uniref:Carboxylesterase type B domain-containing protein n=1 Tax=Darwinula stevensoni TaxID=69355 RepID=A0A7R8X4H8_9CRUS|nr:unnamed protein product [Darwinula stevensoni]CAG0886030.1 unnamed protein product [Darwinula stevensoni]